MGQSEKILNTNTVTREDIRKLLAGSILGIRVPSLLSTEVTLKASEKISMILKKGTRWFLDPEQRVPSDMGYLLAIPRHRARMEAGLRQTYMEKATSFKQDLQRFFPDDVSPVEILQRTFSNAFGTQVPTESFEGSPGLPAILRYMTPSHLFEDCPEGVCHIDSIDGHRLLTVNLYITLPDAGGELQLWDYDVRNQPNTAISKLIRFHAFEQGYRDRIPLLLPRPVIIKMRPGDLFLFDAGKPHAVRSFDQGSRVSLQTFLKIKEDDDSAVVFNS